MHPIFDSVKYKWSNSVAQGLYDQLKIKKDKKWIGRMYLMSGDGLPDLNFDQNSANVWEEALENLAANGYLRSFCELMQREGKPPQLMDALKAAFEMESVTDLKIIDSSPLLDRINLRQKLLALSDQESNTRVIVVRGEKQSGKTHGKLLFTKVARENGGIPIYLSKGQVNNLREVLIQLFAPIGGFTKKRDVKEDTTVDAWHKTICAELLKAARSVKATLWISMDNLGKESNVYQLDTEIKEFFDQLVVQMKNDIYRDHIRLMLIDYPPGDVPEYWDEMLWQEDKTSQTDVEASHIMESIESWSRIKKVNLFKDAIREKAEAIIKEAEELVRSAPPDKPVSRIKSIDTRLKEYLQTL